MRLICLQQDRNIFPFQGKNILIILLLVMKLTMPSMAQNEDIKQKIRELQEDIGHLNQRITVLQAEVERLSQKLENGDFSPSQISDINSLLSDIEMLEGLARFKNLDGTTVLQMGCDLNNTGYAEFHNFRGERTVYIGTDSEGGTIKINGEKIHDYAEVFELKSRTGITPGMVMAMADDGSGLIPSQHAYDKKVVGVISGAGDFRPGMCIGSRSDGTSDLPVAISGQVYVRVCLQGGDIAVGDMLVASDTPGVAMKANDNAKAFGAVIGKALQSFTAEDKKNEHLILMLVKNF